jgi:DNA polymerase III alpha subunit
MRMHNKWGSDISRISSNINWKDRSATREGIRMLGINKQMNNAELKDCIASLSPTQKMQLDAHKSLLLDTHRTTMKHVGGVVFGYHNNINTSTLINVTTDDKHDISRSKTFKIDILSSRSLAIIHACCPTFSNANFVNIDDNPLIFEKIFHCGNNMGLVLAESVLMKRAFLRYKPKNIEELAWCFAIVRPMAKVARDCVSTTTYSIVFDDDVLKYISTNMQVGISEADNIRRKISKGDMSTIEIFIKKIIDNYQTNVSANATTNVSDKNALMTHIDEHVNIISRLSEYGFCKSHSISYAMMIWHMAYFKYTNPTLYWKSCLDHADSSYAKWVHYSEAVSVGVDIKPYSTSVYSQSRIENNVNHMESISERQQLLEYGYWLGLKDGKYYDGCYFIEVAKGVFKFRGILAAIRTPETYKKLKQSGLYLGIGFHKYLDIIVKNMTHFDTKKYVGVEGLCILHNEVENIYETKGYYSCF